MGEVTAFLSHSWSDEKEAPGAKHALVSRWAKRRQETTGKETTLWLVKRSLSLSPHPLLPRITCTHAIKSYAPRTAQDKACIDQNNIQQSLACLPVFLAGCQTLLVVAGPSYCSRLWCVMELFTFARSERQPYISNQRAPARDVPMIESLSHASYSVLVRVSSQWAATKGVSRSILLPTRTMTKHRHGGC